MQLLFFIWVAFLHIITSLFFSDGTHFHCHQARWGAKRTGKISIKPTIFFRKLWLLKFFATDRDKQLQWSVYCGDLNFTFVNKKKLCLQQHVMLAPEFLLFFPVSNSHSLSPWVRLCVFHYFFLKFLFGWAWLVPTHTYSSVFQISEIISRFERKGFKLVAIKIVVPSKEFAQKHYHDLKERPFFNGLCEFLSSGPVIAMVGISTLYYLFDINLFSLLKHSTFAGMGRRGSYYVWSQTHWSHRSSEIRTWNNQRRSSCCCWKVYFLTET